MRRVRPPANGSKPPVDPDAVSGRANAVPGYRGDALHQRHSCREIVPQRSEPPSFLRERMLIKRGVWPVAGCDEVGRGALAGPLVASMAA